MFLLNCHPACVVMGSHSIVFRFLSWRSPSGSRRCGWNSCRGESWGRTVGRGHVAGGKAHSTLFPGPGVSRFKSACFPWSLGGVFLGQWFLGQAPSLAAPLRLHWCGLRSPSRGNPAAGTLAPDHAYPGFTTLPWWCLCLWLCLGDRGCLSTPHSRTGLVSRGHLEVGTSALWELGPAAGPAQQASRECPLCSWRCLLWVLGTQGSPSGVDQACAGSRGEEGPRRVMEKWVVSVFLTSGWKVLSGCKCLQLN